MGGSKIVLMVSYLIFISLQGIVCDPLVKVKRNISSSQFNVDSLEFQNFVVQIASVK